MLILAHFSNIRKNLCERLFVVVSNYHFREHQRHQKTKYWPRCFIRASFGCKTNMIICDTAKPCLKLHNHLCKRKNVLFSIDIFKDKQPSWYMFRNMTYNVTRMGLISNISWLPLVLQNKKLVALHDLGDIFKRKKIYSCEVI